MAPKELKIDGFRSLELYIEQFEDKESALIKVLYEAQQIFGYLSKEVMLFISDKLNVPVSKIYGVVSFYSYFTTEPKGRCQFKVCTGTACFVRGAERIVNQLEHELGLKMGETSSDRKYSLDAVRCVGACGLAPVVLVDDKVYGKAEKDDISRIIKENES
jgi:NADH:ubiquinone oxidoreductase 24 kD subunit